MFTAIINMTARLLFDLAIMAVIIYGVVALCMGSELYEIIRYMGGL